MSRAVLRAFVLSDPLYRYGTPKAPHRSEATKRTLARLVDLLCEGDAAGELTLHDILAQHDEAPSGYDNVLQIARCEDEARNRARYGAFVRRTIVEKVAAGQCERATDDDASDFYAVVAKLGPDIAACSEMALLGEASRLFAPCAPCILPPS